jgi:hypothetical protein
MSDTLNFRRINLAVCGALGIDPAKTQRVELAFGSRESSIKVTSWVTNEKAEALGAVLKEFRLAPKEDAPPGDG